MTKIAISTNGAPSPVGSYSQAISTKDLIFVSGQIGLEPKSGLMCSMDFEKQLNQVFLNLSAICEGSGHTLNDIAKLTVYLSDLNDIQALNLAIPKFFVDPYPARAVVGTTSLPLNALVEIEAIIEKA
tara:strand:- start:153 stop:536 length:384 start_codon:yes stop_codon:yes gene_type:complete